MAHTGLQALPFMFVIRSGPGKCISSYVGPPTSLPVPIPPLRLKATRRNSIPTAIGIGYAPQAKGSAPALSTREETVAMLAPGHFDAGPPQAVRAYHAAGHSFEPP